MYATIHSIPPQLGKTASIGDLVCVIVPANCTTHAVDAQRLGRIVALAEEIGRHWREQDGVNGLLIGQLAESTDGESFVHGGVLDHVVVEIES